MAHPDILLGNIHKEEIQGLILALIYNLHIISPVLIFMIGV